MCVCVCVPLPWEYLRTISATYNVAALSLAPLPTQLKKKEVYENEANFFFKRVHAQMYSI